MRLLAIPGSNCPTPLPVEAQPARTQQVSAASQAICEVFIRRSVPVLRRDAISSGRDQDTGADHPAMDTTKAALVTVQRALARVPPGEVAEGILRAHGQEKEVHQADVRP